MIKSLSFRVAVTISLFVTSGWLVSLQATSRDFGDEPVYRMRRRLCMMC